MLLNTLDSSNIDMWNKKVRCRLSTEILLLVEDGVDRPLPHVRLFAMSPGLIWEQIKAGVRVRTVLTAGEEIPAGKRAGP